ncbi:hypothetical protein JCM24511_01537 [Saitozyma sp. JCM 24511]|nr:hypothetical protein JCM24511_01537 [Saitozyma sp. JCM 24511]
MAYGAIAAPLQLAELPTLSFPLPGGWQLSTHPIKGAEAPKEVLEYLYGVFSKELQDGRTYPQEGPMDYPAFIAYFFASTTIVGVVHTEPQTSVPQTLEEALGGRDPVEAIGGCYYIKPNYPGRSSHNCNAGFIVPPTHRGKKIGYNLGKSYLEYAPRLGYKASVFNLVYKNNVASLKIWDSLGFQRVGLIPNAGRLRTQDGLGEEYVDAVVVHKSFV